jgi:hypothetical protein
MRSRGGWDIIRSIEMTMRLVDVAPNEAPLVMLIDRLEKVLECKALTEEEIRSLLAMDSPPSVEHPSGDRNLLKTARVSPPGIVEAMPD